MSTPEEERRKQMKYRYLTWHLRTKTCGMEVESWARRERKTAEECEEEMREWDNRSKVETWLICREGFGGFEVASAVF